MTTSFLAGIKHSLGAAVAQEEQPVANRKDAGGYADDGAVVGVGRHHCPQPQANGGHL